MAVKKYTYNDDVLDIKYDVVDINDKELNIKR